MKGATRVETKNLWTIHGQQYDLSDFVAHHPGGAESILLGRGRDCTAMFESYHPFTNAHRTVLKKYQQQGASPCTAASEWDPFYSVLKTRVQKTLKDHGIDPKLDRTAPNHRIAYYLFIVGCIAVTAIYHAKGNLIASVLFGVFGCLSGALGHDGGHYSVSRKPIINDIAIWGLSLFSNPELWLHQHNYGHHSHTNTFGRDPDVHHYAGFLRVHRRTKSSCLIRMQKSRLYALLMLSLHTTYETCIRNPLAMITSGNLYGVVHWTDRMRPKRFFVMLFHFILYMVVVFVAPFFSGKPWHIAIFAGGLHMMTTGLVFGAFSQVSHLNQAALELECKLAKSSWAARQIVATNNFATRSTLWYLLSCGLCFQIEHHLFPGLSSSHLHIIAPVVEGTCKEFDVPYKSFGSYWDVLGSMLQWFDTLSSAEKVKAKEMKVD